MTYTFHVVDEKKMPLDSHRGRQEATPEAIIDAIRTHGGHCSSIQTSAEQFIETFSALDRFIGGENLLSELAFAGSPHFLLTGHPGKWQLGYYAAELVPNLYGVFRLQSPVIAPTMKMRGEGVMSIYRALFTALEEAQACNHAVAIVHE